MRVFARLGWRNVFRQRLRTALALGAIALAVALVVVGTTFSAGMEQMIFSEVLGDLGEVVVAEQRWFDRARFNPLRHSLQESAALRARIEAVEGVRAALERIDFGLLAQVGEEAEPIACSAVDPEAYARFSKLPQRLVAGRWPERGERALLLGLEVAGRLGVRPGDELTVLGRTVYDSFTADDFTVAGIFDLGTKAANRTSFMPLAAAQEFLEMSDAASRILVFGTHWDEADALAARLRSGGVLPPGVAVRPWTEDSLIGSMRSLSSAMNVVISSILCFVAGLGILNMTMVSVLERRREIGVLMALGMSRPAILGAFLYEAALYGLLGSALGLALGSPLAVYLDVVGLDFRTDEVQGLPFPLPNTLHGRFGPGSLLTGLAIGVLLSVLGMIWPMLKTFSMKPRDAMAR